MRLVDTETLKLVEFYTSSAIPGFGTQPLHSNDNQNGIPKYAILSHVWGPEEASFQEMLGDRKAIRHKKGFIKIKKSCARAQRDGYRYLWIDTCGIDKTSSTELSEAINTMYAWYKDSAICYVYLEDVFEESEDDKAGEFDKSRWFTRGWTLQELLAPSQLHFFDRDWKRLGTKSDLLSEISRITKIDLYALTGGDLSRLTVARRMSWIAERQTTRLEDMAYCLLGIFDINMPMLYGEGIKAFIRLQEEIRKTTDDQSIFAWKDPTAEHYRDDYPDAFNPQGLLAPLPRYFQYSKSISQYYVDNLGPSAVSTNTNRGLKVELLMSQDLSYPSGLVYMAILQCNIGDTPGHLAGIRLKRLAIISDQYARIDIHSVFKFTKDTPDHSALNLPGLPLTHLEYFDPRKPQASLMEVNTRRLFKDWKLMSIFIRQEPKVPLLPTFWLAIPASVPSRPDLPARLTFSDAVSDGFFQKFIEWTKSSIFSESRKEGPTLLFNQVRAAYPPEFYDSETRTFQSQPVLGGGAKKIGALLVDYKGTTCILIFGLTYWESFPWCQIIETNAETDCYNSDLREEFIYFVENELSKTFNWREYRLQCRERLNKIFQRQAQRPARILYEQEQDLRERFESFNINDVDLPVNMDDRGHRCVCESLGLVSIVEHTVVAGREMYLVRLFHKSEEHN